MNYQIALAAFGGWLCLALPSLVLCIDSGMAIAQVTDPESLSAQSDELPQLPSASPEQDLESPEVTPLTRQNSSPETIQSNTNTSRYLLGPGDQIGLAVVDYPEFSQTRVILPDGTVLLPLIGSVVASGKTLEALQAEITSRLSFYLIDPVVELNLSVLRPLVVTIAGEVYRPGPVQLNSLTNVNTRVGNDSQLSSGSTTPTLSTALVNAGGVRRTADLRNIRVQRQLPNGRQTTLTVNLWESIFQGTQGEDILLQDGDIVFVQEAPDSSEVDPQLVSRSSLAPELVRVRVIGEVNRPGEVEVSPDGTVLTAMALAGGHNDDANLRTVSLLRLGDTGQMENQTLNLSDFEDATPIRDGDLIVVPKRGYLNVLDGIARTLQPITTPFNLFNLLNNIFD
ncbi:MAG: polysaccharide biosynthesis/export family protein [Cyanobacteria bacterium P01_A01_bin.123]